MWTENVHIRRVANGYIVDFHDDDGGLTTHIATTLDEVLEHVEEYFEDFRCLE